MAARHWNCRTVDVVARNATVGRASRRTTTSLKRITYQKVTIRDHHRQSRNAIQQYCSDLNPTASMRWRKESSSLSLMQKSSGGLRKASSTISPARPSAPTLPPRQTTSDTHLSAPAPPEDSNPILDVPVIKLPSQSLGYSKPEPLYGSFKTIDKTYREIFNGLPDSSQKNSPFEFFRSLNRELNQTRFMSFLGPIAYVLALWFLITVMDHVEISRNGVRWIGKPGPPLRTNPQRGVLPTPSDQDTISNQGDVDEELERGIESAMNALKMTEAGVPLGSLDELLDSKGSEDAAATVAGGADAIGTAPESQQELENSTQRPWYRFW